MPPGPNRGIKPEAPGTSVPVRYLAEMTRTRVSQANARSQYRGQHHFRHWYRDNQVYFITARCRDRFPSFAAEQAKEIFWDRFSHHSRRHGFTPWITSLLDNHYHTLGYLRRGDQLTPMMRQLHGSVAKLVNDLLPRPCLPMFGDRRDRSYFDGCLRSEKQGRATYRYIQIQSQRHGVCGDWRTYRHMRIEVELEPAIRRASELGAFLEGVPYRRYGGGRGTAGHGHRSAPSLARYANRAPGTSVPVMDEDRSEESLSPNRPCGGRLRGRWRLRGRVGWRGLGGS